MRGLGDLVSAPSALDFFFLFLSGSSLGSRAALCRLLRLLDELDCVSVSEIPPSLARLLFLFFLALLSSLEPLTARFTLPSTESSMSDGPVVVELLDDSETGSLSANRTIIGHQVIVARECTRFGLAMVLGDLDEDRSAMRSRSCRGVTTAESPASN